MARAALSIALVLAGSFPIVATAQPADLPIPAATTDTYPPGVKIAKTKAGTVYADRKGRTLYGLDMRVLLRAGPDPAQYCTDECASLWEPLLAPPDSQPNIAFPNGSRQDEATQASEPTFYRQPQSAPDWTIIASAQGPQWVYKGWHLVFARRGDKRGSTEFEGAQDMAWNTLKFVPPFPKQAMPANVTPVVIDGDTMLASTQGRVLFTGECERACQDWRPLSAGVAAAGLGDWTVKKDGDVPQWTWRGQPVFVTAEGDPNVVPLGAKALRPIQGGMR